MARILMANADALEQIDRSFAAKLLEEVPVLATAVAAAKRLALLLRKRSQEALDDVLTAASTTPLAGFVRPDLNGANTQLFENARINQADGDL